MSIQPIDLQTLFVKMNLVGKEHSAQKNSVIVRQEIQGEEIVKKHQHDDHSVNKTETADEGLGKTKDDLNEENNPDKKHQQQHNHEAKENLESKEILRDPNLGKNIDVSG